MSPDLMKTFTDEKKREWIIKRVSFLKGNYPVITIPVQVLKKLGLKKGDIVAIHFDEKNKAILIRKIKIVLEE